jgi:hypothetical protein
VDLGRVLDLTAAARAVGDLAAVLDSPHIYGSRVRNRMKMERVEPPTASINHRAEVPVVRLKPRTPWKGTPFVRKNETRTARLCRAPSPRRHPSRSSGGTRRQLVWTRRDRRDLVSIPRYRSSRLMTSASEECCAVFVKELVQCAGVVSGDLSEGVGRSVVLAGGDRPLARDEQLGLRCRYS